MKWRIFPILVVFVFCYTGIFLIAARGQEFKYMSKGKRDPFVPLATGEVRANLGLQSVETIEDVRFEGIIFDPAGKSMVVLNGEVMKEGDKLYNVEIVKIGGSSVIIKVNGKAHAISLVEEGGEKN